MSDEVVSGNMYRVSEAEAALLSGNVKGWVKGEEKLSRRTADRINVTGEVDPKKAGNLISEVLITDLHDGYNAIVATGPSNEGGHVDSSMTVMFKRIRLTEKQVELFRK